MAAPAQNSTPILQDLCNANPFTIALSETTFFGNVFFLDLSSKIAAWGKHFFQTTQASFRDAFYTENLSFFYRVFRLLLVAPVCASLGTTLYLLATVGVIIEIALGLLLGFIAGSLEHVVRSISSAHSEKFDQVYQEALKKQNSSQPFGSGSSFDPQPGSNSVVFNAYE